MFTVFSFKYNSIFDLTELYCFLLWPVTFLPLERTRGSNPQTVGAAKILARSPKSNWASNPTSEFVKGFYAVKHYNSRQDGSAATLRFRLLEILEYTYLLTITSPIVLFTFGADRTGKAQQ